MSVPPRPCSPLLLQIRFCAVVSEELVTWFSGPAQPAASPAVLLSSPHSPTLRMLLAPSPVCLAVSGPTLSPGQPPRFWPEYSAVLLSVIPAGLDPPPTQLRKSPVSVILELNLRIQPKLQTKLPVGAPEFFSFPVREFPKMYPLRCLA